MNRVILFLLIGIFIMSTVCLASTNKDALKAIQLPAQRAAVEQAVLAQLTPGANIRAILTQAMQANNVPDVQAQQVLNSLPNIAGAWEGRVLTPEESASITAAAVAVTAPENIITAEEMKANQAPLINTIAAEMNTTADQIAVPMMKIVPQEVMDQANVHGPIIMKIDGQDVIVIGEADHQTFTEALPSRLAHEFTELTLLHQGQAQAQAHEGALRVEAAVRKAQAATNEAERAAMIAEANCDRAWQIAGLIPDGVKRIELEATAELAGRSEFKAQVEYLKRRDIQVTVKTLPTPAGANHGLNVTMKDAKGNVVGKTATHAVKGQLRRVTGIFNEGLLDALIPAIAVDAPEGARVQWAKDNMQQIKLLLEQRQANIVGDAEFNAKVAELNNALAAENLKDLPGLINKLAVLELPAPTPVDIKDQMEQEMARQIFGRMA